MRSLLALLLFASPLQAQQTFSDGHVGVYLKIAPEHRVRNTRGNCAFCAVETIARYQGVTELHGFAVGKGGANPSSMRAYLDARGIEYKATPQGQKAVGWANIRGNIAEGRPVMFDIPGHALVCCGITTKAGKEYVWVIDNTGSESVIPKGWPKAEFDAKFNGWTCAIQRCRPGFCPLPKAKPAHIDPPEEIEPKTDTSSKLDKLLERIEEVAKMKAIPGPSGLPGLHGKDGINGKDADNTALLIELEKLRAENLKAIQAIEQLRRQPYTAELYDTSGRLMRSTTFSKEQPLKLFLLPVQ